MFCEFFSEMHWWDLLGLAFGAFGILHGICSDRKKDTAVRIMRDVASHTEGFMHGLKPGIQHMPGLTDEQKRDWLAQIHDIMERCTVARENADKL